jgi:anti-sigma B factor antagonist
MKFNTEERYNAVIIYFDGETLTGDETPDFNHLLHKLLDEGKKNIIFDVSSVRFVNSTGIGLLIGGYTTVQNANGQVRLVGAQERIQSLLVITKLASVFKMYETVDEAVKSF